MCGFLVDLFPDAIEIDGEAFDVNTDFRVGLQIMADFEGGEFDQEECAYLMLQRLYVDLPSDRGSDFYMEAIEKATKFLNAGEDTPSDIEEKPRTFSFVKDAKYIYSAFSQAHGIDLQKEDMHWWRFVTLFNDLGECTFNTLRYLRGKQTLGDVSEHEQKMIDNFGADFYLDSLSVEYEPDEDELEFISLLPIEDQKIYWEGRKR